MEGSQEVDVSDPSNFNQRLGIGNDLAAPVAKRTEAWWMECKILRWAAVAEEYTSQAYCVSLLNTMHPMTICEWVRIWMDTSEAAEVHHNHLGRKEAKPIRTSLVQHPVKGKLHAPLWHWHTRNSKADLQFVNIHQVICTILQRLVNGINYYCKYRDTEDASLGNTLGCTNPHTKTATTKGLLIKDWKVTTQVIFVKVLQDAMLPHVATCLSKLNK